MYAGDFQIHIVCRCVHEIVDDAMRASACPTHKLYTRGNFIYVDHHHDQCHK
jgi:hypothetical protein